MKFIHVADLHLGYEQYNLRERMVDFASAFKQVVDFAINKKVDFVLISGDLFDKRDINADTLEQADVLINKLKKANIKVIAIEGNHDKQSLSSRGSFLKYLNNKSSIILLRNTYKKDGSIELNEWDPTSRTGAYIDLDGARVYGLNYLGALSSSRVEEIAPILKKKDITILMMHAGLQGKIHKNDSGIEKSKLDGIRDKIDYLALGHVHEKYDEDKWIFNPGSPETTDITEKQEKGFYYYDGNKINFILVKNRPVVRLHMKATKYNTPDEIIEGLKELLETQTTYDEKPIVEFVLDGSVSFDKFDIDIELIIKLIKDKTSALIVRVNNLTTAPDFYFEDAGLGRKELEEKTFRQLIKVDTRYNKNEEEVFRLFCELKDLALRKAGPKEIISFLREYSQNDNK